MRLLSSSLTTLTKTTLSSFGRLSRRRFRRLSTSSSRFSVQRRNDDKIQTRRNNGALFFAMMSPVVVLIDGGSGGGATMMTTTTQFVMRMGVDATLAASIALAAMHSYARSNDDDDDDLDENDDDENENDLRTRWTVASLVALLPVFGVVSWILPRVSVGSWEVEETSEEEAKRQKRCALYAAMYLASYAAFGGFDVTRKETWVVTALSFAHFQIESPFGALKKRNAKEEQDETGTFAIEEIAASLKASVLGGASSNSSSGSNSRSSSSNRSSSVTGAEKRRDAERSNSSFAKHLGEYLGELQVQLRNLPMDVEEGRIRAQIEREIDATEQMLEREKSIASDEIEKWDRKWMLRRMKKPELIETCKRNGIKGYSRLNKMDIVEMIEKFEEQEEASVEEA